MSLLITKQAMRDFVNLLNNNQGVVDAIGLLLIIPLAIVSERLLSKRRDKQHKRDLVDMLLRELWINLNFISQIEVSYNNNFKDKFAHVPHYPPRTIILDTFFQYDLIASLEKENKECFVEVFAQISELRREFLEWKKLVSTTQLKRDLSLYEKVSETMLSYVGPTMQNIMDLWLILVDKYGLTSKEQKIVKFSNRIKKLIHDGKWVKAYYKSSYYYKYPPARKVDVIFCWIDDNKEKDGTLEQEIIPIQDSLALHDSWRD